MRKSSNWIISPGIGVKIPKIFELPPPSVVRKMIPKMEPQLLILGTLTLVTQKIKLHHTAKIICKLYTHMQ